jgi:hypothetical protein
LRILVECNIRAKSSGVAIFFIELFVSLGSRVTPIDSGTQAFVRNQVVLPYSEAATAAGPSIRPFPANSAPSISLPPRDSAGDDDDYYISSALAPVLPAWPHPTELQIAHIGLN